MGLVMFVCDGCGKEEPGCYVNGHWSKPSLWFARTAKDTDESGFERDVEVVACCRACIAKVDDKRNERAWIMPSL